MKKKTDIRLKKLIEFSKSRFGDKYSFNKSVFIAPRQPIVITCNKHGDFKTTPEVFKQTKLGCKACGYEHISKKQSYTKEDFERVCEVKFGSRLTCIEYDKYDNVAKLNCEVHGIFHKAPKLVVKSKHGCSKCARDNIAKIHSASQKDVISKFKKKHGDKFDYSKVDYTNSASKVRIICKKHGEFEQLPLDHLNSTYGCRKCVAEHTKAHGYKKSRFINICEGNSAYLYLIKMTGEGESFIKIGISKSPERRMKEYPYECEILSKYKGEAGEVWELEKAFHKNNKHNKYTPQKRFAGETECFKTGLN